jgi:pyridinium-3,5-biscarboxylic acid mononucleotide synthase
MPEAVYGRGRPRAVRRRSSASCSRTGPARCCSPAPTTRTHGAARRPRRGTREASGSLLWRAPDPIDLPPTSNVERTTAGPAGRPIVTAGTATSRWPTRRPLTLRAYGFARPVVTTWASPGCTGCWRTPRRPHRRRRVIVVAGMEGALASVLGGLTGAPVVAVPTSVGYGAGLDGSPPCSRCTPRARVASRWSASTTASARHVPSLASSRGRPDDPHRRRTRSTPPAAEGSPGSTARRVWPAT